MEQVSIGTKFFRYFNIAIRWPLTSRTVSQRPCCKQSNVEEGAYFYVPKYPLLAHFLRQRFFYFPYFEKTKQLFDKRLICTYYSYSVDEGMLNKFQISRSNSAASSTEDINIKGENIMWGFFHYVSVVDSKSR